MIDKINQLADYIAENAWGNDIEIETNYDDDNFTKVICNKEHGYVSFRLDDLEIDFHNRYYVVTTNYNYTKTVEENGLQKVLDKCKELFDAELEKRK